MTSSSRESDGSPASIFFLIRSLHVGGAERQLIHLASGLHALGHRVTVAVYYGGGVLDAELRDRGIIFLDLGKRSRWDLLGFCKRLICAVREEKPDALYAFLGTSNILGAAIRPFIPPTKLIWSVRSSYMDVSAYDWLSRLSYRLECALSGFADLIICNSQAGLAYAAAHGFPERKMVVIPNGIDTARFAPDPVARTALRRAWGVSDQETLVGILARFDPMKDHATFLRAAALAAKARPDMRFVCIGDGPRHTTERLQALAADLGLGSRVIWPGSFQDPAGALSALDICCSSSTGEGFSNSIAEAMACGVPCVVTDVGDSRTIVGATGRVVPARDEESMSDAMVELSSELGETTSRRARARIVEHFSLGAMVEETARRLRPPRRIAQGQDPPVELGSD